MEITLTLNGAKNQKNTIHQKIDPNVPVFPLGGEMGDAIYANQGVITKETVGKILNDIILALGLNRTQITMYMGMIKQQRRKYDF